VKRAGSKEMKRSAAFRGFRETKVKNQKDHDTKREVAFKGEKIRLKNLGGEKSRKRAESFTNFPGRKNQG